MDGSVVNTIEYSGARKVETTTIFFLKIIKMKREFKHKIVIK